jgi:hypothetical protein
MVSRVSVTCGNVLASRIVPVTLNRIVSSPVPAAQPFVAVIVFAAVIASRKAQIPAAPGSASELTTILAARASVLSVSTKTAAIEDASTARILNIALITAAALRCTAAELQDLG